MAGRKPKYTPEQINTLCTQLEDYINNTNIPSIQGFCYKYNITRQTLYDYEQFSTLKERLINKKESVIEEWALKNKINATMAIFSLKQLGWSDKQEIAHSGVIENKTHEAILDALKNRKIEGFNE